MCSSFSYFYTFLFTVRKHVNYCETISFSLLYLTLLTLCIIGLFLCCHLLYLIIYLSRTQKLSWHLWRKNTDVLSVYKFYVAIYCTRIYLDFTFSYPLSGYPPPNWSVEPNWFTPISIPSLEYSRFPLLSIISGIVINQNHEAFFQREIFLKNHFKMAGSGMLKNQSLLALAGVGADHG